MTTPALTEDGKRLADALVKADHEFKAHPTVFHPARRGDKTFEFRKDDRGGYHVGQTVCLRCYTLETGYTGDAPLYRIITDILRPGEFGLQDGYCILSLRPLTAPEGEGAGLREAARTLLNACHADFGKPESETDDHRDDGPVGGGATPADDMAITFAMLRDLENALTKPPAAQEPAAAGVPVGWKLVPVEATEKMFQAGLDAPGDKRPLDWERKDVPEYMPWVWTAMLNAAPAPLLTPAAPKTPDAATGGSVGDGGLREETEKWSVASGFPHTAESSAAWMDGAAMFSRNADFYHGIVVQIGEMFGDAAKTSDDGSLQDSVLALKVPGLVATALTKPPAAQEPAAAGVSPERIAELLSEYGDYDADCPLGRVYGTAKIWEFAAILRATLTPAAPKTPDAATGGEDEPEADLPRIDRIERQMLEHGGVDSDDMEWMADMTRATIELSATGGSVGDAGLREALGEPHCWVVPGRDTANDYGTVDAHCVEHGEMSRPLWPLEAVQGALAALAQPALAGGIRSILTEARSGLHAFTGGDDGACGSTIARIDAVLQGLPAPVGEDETGVREARGSLTFSSQYHRDEIAHRVPNDDDGETLARVRSDASLLHAALGTGSAKGFMPETVAGVRAACAALAPQPPKAETPAGVEALFGSDEYVPDLPSAVAAEVMGLAWTHAPGDDVDEHCDRYGAVQEIVDRVLRRPEFAALSTAPAAQPGDEVERAITYFGECVANGRQPS